MKYLFLICLCSLCYSGCKNKPAECEHYYMENGRINFIANGCFVDSLEDGHWTVSDTLSNFIEKGNFERGIRNGTWHYSSTKAGIDSIKWIRYEDASQKLLTNRPEFLDDIWSDSTHTRWRLSDTTKHLYVVIANRYAIGLDVDIDSFHLQGSKDLEKLGFGVNILQHDQVKAPGMTYYFTSYELAKVNNRFYLMSCYAFFEGRLVEVIVRYEDGLALLSKKIFESVSGSLFINQHRFMTPLSYIEEIKKR